MHTYRFSPPESHPTSGYHHVTVTTPGRFVFLAGQCPLDSNEELVGAGDYDAQVDKIADNALLALRSAGARPDDVVRTVVYVASADSEVLARVWHRFAEETPLAAGFGSASTLVGVTVLGYPGQLVEVDLTATLPDQQ